MAHWNEGWSTAFSALEGLTDADLGRTVTINNEPHRVHRALLRLLAHAGYHAGQIVFVAKAARGAAWKPSK
jgi:hypothetical protein